MHASGPLDVLGSQAKTDITAMPQPLLSNFVLQFRCTHGTSLPPTATSLMAPENGKGKEPPPFTRDSQDSPLCCTAPELPHVWPGTPGKQYQARSCPSALGAQGLAGYPSSPTQGPRQPTLPFGEPCPRGMARLLQCARPQRMPRCLPSAWAPTGAPQCE